MLLKSLKYFGCVVAVIATVITFTNTVNATEVPNPITKEYIENTIHEYLVANGDVVLDSIVKFQTNKILKKQKVSIESYKKDIYSAPHSPYAGNLKGDVSIAEFSDYNCGYCKKSAEVVAKLLEKDKNVRVIFKEFPVLGPASEIAAKWAFAAHKQNKYFQFHMALMRNRKPLTDKSLTKIAKSVNLDIDKLKKDLKSKDIEGYIKADKTLAFGLEIKGTPVFVIGDKVKFGALSLEQLEEEIKIQRALNKSKK